MSYGEHRVPYTRVVEVQTGLPLWRAIWQSLMKLKKCMPRIPAVPLQTHPRETQVHMHKEIVKECSWYHYGKENRKQPEWS
jgi:hypothetical protein